MVVLNFTRRFRPHRLLTSITLATRLTESSGYFLFFQDSYFFSDFTEEIVSPVRTYRSWHSRQRRPPVGLSRYNTGYIAF